MKPLERDIAKAQKDPLYLLVLEQIRTTDTIFNILCAEIPLPPDALWGVARRIMEAL